MRRGLERARESMSASRDAVWQSAERRALRESATECAEQSCLVGAEAKGATAEAVHCSSNTLRSSPSTSRSEAELIARDASTRVTGPYRYAPTSGPRSGRASLLSPQCLGTSGGSCLHSRSRHHCESVGCLYGYLFHGAAMCYVAARGRSSERDLDALLQQRIARRKPTSVPCSMLQGCQGRTMIGQLTY